MNLTINTHYKAKLISVLTIIVSIATSCKEFVEVDPPKTTLTTSTVFSSQETANAAVLRVYIAMTQYYTSFVSGETSLTNLSGLASDEFTNYNSSSDFIQFEQNALTSANANVSQDWTEIYGLVYSVNAVLEGLEGSATISAAAKNHLKGEAKFLRAFLYFYLVNFWGDVPLLTSTDYKVNSVAPRTSANKVYDQIIADLTDSQSLMDDAPVTDRIRPIKSAATALLARVYLYNSRWADAEAQASDLLQNSSYTLESNLNNVFLKGSQETIWQLQSIAAYINTWDGYTFVLNGAPYNVALTNDFLNSLESSDLRKTNWVNTYTDGTSTWYYPFKYKVKYLSSATAPKTEYLVVLRLAEQLLIRAEARAQQNNLVGATSDLNALRTRAGLPNTTASDQASLLSAIAQENRAEFFAEWSHRWLDLKRTGRVDVVLSAFKTGWQPTDALLPIPKLDMDRNNQLTQNLGY